MTIAEIAARNVQRRQEMIARLAPVRVEAKAKAETFYRAKSGVKDTRAVLEMVSSLKHVPGFFPTPAKLVDRMIEAADLAPTHSVLEPSAGKGDIAAAVVREGATVECIEKNSTLAEHLRKTFETKCADFLEVLPDPRFDRVLMNPPFERGIDEKHIRHAFNFLRPGGRLVAIACVTTGKRLEPWAGERGGYLTPLPAGSFATSDRPTQVHTALVVANA